MKIMSSSLLSCFVRGKFSILGLLAVASIVPVLANDDSQRILDQSEILNYGKFLEEHNDGTIDNTNPSRIGWKTHLDQFVGRTVKIFQHNILFLKKEISYHLERNQFTDWDIDALRALALRAEDLDTDAGQQIRKAEISQNGKKEESKKPTFMDFRNPISLDTNELHEFVSLLDRKLGKPLVDQVVKMKEALESEVGLEVDENVPASNNPLDAIKAGFERMSAPIKSLIESARSDFWDYLKDEGIVDIKRQVKERAIEAKRTWMRIDWRVTKCISEPRQQSLCNSCYAISIVSLIEYYYCREFGKSISFSPQYIVDCGQQAGLRGCKGGKLTKVGQFIQRNGLKLDSDFPYTGQEGQCEANKKESYVFPNFKNWQHIHMHDEADETSADADRWLSHLKKGPLLVGIGMPADFFAYAGGIHDGRNCDPDLAHAMLLMGYGVQDGKEFWLLQNSFSKDWGEGGYFRLAKDAPSECFSAVIVAQPGFRVQ